MGNPTFNTKKNPHTSFGIDGKGGFENCVDYGFTRRVDTCMAKHWSTQSLAPPSFCGGWKMHAC